MGKNTAEILEMLVITRSPQQIVNRLKVVRKWKLMYSPEEKRKSPTEFYR